MNSASSLYTYAYAPQLIPATFDMLKGYCGKVYVKLYDSEVESILSFTPDKGEDFGKAVFVAVDGEIGRLSIPIEEIFLDPTRSDVRDHLIRSLTLPRWVRDDLSEKGLAPWQSAGLISCAAALATAGQTVQCLLPEWIWYEDGWERGRPIAGSAINLPHVTGSDPSRITTATSLGWCFGSKWTKRQGPETNLNGKALADAEALKNLCALVYDEDTLLLPWPAGPRFWPRIFDD